MFSYGWSETLASLFFTRHLLTLYSTSPEYRFLLREIIEEFQHQEMFSSIVMKMGVDPIQPSRFHKFVGKFTAKYLPADLLFMSILAVEFIADTYGKIIRKDERVYNVLRNVSELHYIEEGRHIHYNKMWTKKFTDGGRSLQKIDVQYRDYDQRLFHANALCEARNIQKNRS